MVRRREKTDPGARAPVCSGKRRFIEANRATGGRDETGEELEQSRLAGAVWAKQSDEVAGREIEIEISERPQKAVRFGEFVDGYAQFVQSIRFATARRQRIDRI